MKKLNYSYQVIPIGEDGEEAYEAIIPKFRNVHVYGDTLEELHEGVCFSIEYEIEELIKEGRPIPSPDKKPATTFKGKIILRTTPELHERLYYEAQANNLSLNKYIEKRLLGTA